MRCTYKDDFKVDYSGSLHVSKGDGVEFTVNEGQIPSDIKSSLDTAVSHNSCHELREASRTLANSVKEAFDIE